MIRTYYNWLKEEIYIEEAPQMHASMEDFYTKSLDRYIARIGAPPGWFRNMRYLKKLPQKERSNKLYIQTEVFYLTACRHYYGKGI